MMKRLALLTFALVLGSISMVQASTNCNKKLYGARGTIQITNVQSSGYVLPTAGSSNTIGVNLNVKHGTGVKLGNSSISVNVKNVTPTYFNRGLISQGNSAYETAIPIELVWRHEFCRTPTVQYTQQNVGPSAVDENSGVVGLNNFLFNSGNASKTGAEALIISTVVGVSPTDPADDPIRNAIIVALDNLCLHVNASQEKCK